MQQRRRIQLFCLVWVMFLAACGEAANSVPSTAIPTQTAEPTATSLAARGDQEPDASTLAPEDAPIGQGRGVIYSVPFKVQPDGFGFRNYGPGYPEGDFTIVELRQLFGDGVCSRVDADSDKCIPTAEAQQWIADRNADMRVGHCIGFTVTSYRFTEGDLQPAAFSATAATPYDLQQDAPIMRAIALNGSLYWVKSVWSSEVAGTPRDIIDTLIARREAVDLSIFLPGLVGGHSLLAYGVEEIAPGQYHILVYDNNYPGSESFVAVDYEANTWRYDRGAVNPEEQAVPYEGDAATETLRFIPLAAYDSATCPFCPADEGEDAPDAVTLVSVLGQGEVLIKTALGAIGSVAGEIIDELPGAKLLFQRGQFAANGSPDIALPSGAEFSLEFSGLERVSTQSPTLSLVVDNLTTSTETNQLIVDAESQTIDFQAGGEQSPLVNVVVRQDEASYSVALIGVDFEAGQGVSMGAPESGQGLELRAQAIDIRNATLLITRQTTEDEAIFATTDLIIEEDGGVRLDITEWDGRGSIDVYPDEDGDGAYEEEPEELDNTPLEEILEESDLTDSATILDHITPIQGDDGAALILSSLSIETLTGRAIGALLQPLDLTDEQLIDYLPTLLLPAPELAELLFALRLTPERLDAIIEGLALEAEVEAALWAALAELVLFQEIMAEWAFLNTEDLTQLAELIAARELAPLQLARFIARLELDPAAIDQLLLALGLPEDVLAAVVDELGITMPAVPATPTMTPTATGAASDPATPATPTPTLTATATLSATVVMTGTPEATPTPEPYPGQPPMPTDTPEPYPYPVEEPTPTPDGDPYPGPSPSPTPDFDSRAFCEGDDLRIVAEEVTWREAEVEIWAGETLLFSGVIGPDGEPFEVTALGPGTWEDLRIESSLEPEVVQLGVFTCPQPVEEKTGLIGAVLRVVLGWP